MSKVSLIRDPHRELIWRPSKPIHQLINNAEKIAIELGLEKYIEDGIDDILNE